jgi:4,4'-diaponeurosporenoate glycosyltransferase
VAGIASEIADLPGIRNDDGTEMELFHFMPIVSLALWSGGWLVLGRIQRCRRNRGERSAPGGRLSIIIPARNEQANLPKLLRSLAAQSVQAGEIIVVDDASTDGTADVARQHGARVVSSQPLPDGWRGKTWACHQGALAATGELLLFLDADTWFESDGLRSVLDEFQAAGGGALSVAPHHQVRKFHEQFSAFFNLVMLAGTGAFTLRGDQLAPRGLLGQFLLVGRDMYDRVGGHEAVKGRILENFWLAVQFRAAGVPLHCRAGRDVFAFRMYPNSWLELIEGWTKGFASGAGQTPPAILWLVIAWTSGLMLAPLAMALDGFRWPGLVAYALCATQVGWLLRKAGSFRWVTALLYPVPLVFFFAVFGRSVSRAARKQTVEWKGRKIRAG